MAQKEGQVLFVCTRFPEVNLVIDSKDIVTNEKTGRTHAYAGKEVHFVKHGFEGGIRGEYVTDDADTIEFIRGHEWYNRYIKEVPIAAKVDRTQPQTVVAGTTDSGVKEPQAPADNPEAAGSARISQSVRRGRPPKAKVAA